MTENELEAIIMPENTDEYDRMWEIVNRLEAYLKKYNIKMLTVDAADVEGAHRITVSEAARQGRIPAVRIPGSNRWLVPAGAVQAAFDAGKLTGGVKGRPRETERITGTCSVCGKPDVRGTKAKQLAYQHDNPKTGKKCRGSGQPLLKVTVTPIEG